MLYRVFTENKNRNRVIEPTVKKYFDAFTIVNATGYWNGTTEASVVIEIVVIEPSLAVQHNVELMAHELKRLNKQETVLIQVIANSAQFI